ncbi:hypothetical protein V8D89_006008 [Ganoderma adspersum]
MGSPSLPWEVLERIIGHCGDPPKTLHNFSLTCRDLRPRALCLLVADVVFKGRRPIFDFCDFLQANPHLRPFVRSIVVNPDDFSPFPLISILPNLSKVKFTRIQPAPPQIRSLTVLNQSSLTCCERFGIHIQTLHLSKISFPTYPDFARVLLTFTNLIDLVCSSVAIRAEGNRAPLDVLKRRLSERLHLRTIDIDYFGCSEEDFHDAPSVAALLLDSGLVQSTVEALAVQPYRSYGLSHVFDWPPLRSLVLKLVFIIRDITGAIALLKDFPPSTLKDVMVELRRRSIGDINDTLSAKDSSKQLQELEQALLRFARPRMACLVDHLHDGTTSFWTQELATRFPTLFQRGAFTFASRTVLPGVGHDYGVRGLATSPDGKWVATWSLDSTIKLWDTADGAMVQQWIAHSCRPVTSLAFSPDGRYFVSGGDDSKLKIWDLTAAEGSREVTTLEGHTHHIICCTWSPRGDIIASGSHDDTVRLWDARTFRELHVLENPDLGRDYIDEIVFSPDGRWLVYGSSRSYHIWNVASSSPHKSFLAGAVHHLAGFDSGSARLLVPEGEAVKLVDVETGDELSALRGLDRSTGAALSSDGTMVVTGSYDGMVKLWDANTGVELFSLEGHEEEVREARFSPCGRYVASASSDGTRGAFTLTHTTDIPGEGHDDMMQYFTTSLDGRWAATGSKDSTIILWDAADGTMAQRWVAHSRKPVRALAFSPDSRYLVSGGDDPNVKVWDLSEGVSEVATLGGHTYPVHSCAWSPRGDTIASASMEDTIRLWDAHTFHQLHTLEHSLHGLNAIGLIIFSPDGRWLVSGMPMYDHRVWDVASGKLHKSFLNALRDDHADTAYSFPAAAFDPAHSARLALVPGPKLVQILDVETGEELAVLEGASNTLDIAFSPDGARVVTVSADSTAPRVRDACAVTIWDARTGTALSVLEQHERRVSQALFSPCGQYIASASLDGTVRLWRTSDGSVVMTPVMTPSHDL